MVEPTKAAREALMPQILEKWCGVDTVDPSSGKDKDLLYGGYEAYTYIFDSMRKKLGVEVSFKDMSDITL